VANARLLRQADFASDAERGPLSAVLRHSVARTGCLGFDPYRGQINRETLAANDLPLLRATTALAVRTARASSPVSAKTLFATSLHIRRSASVSALWVWRGASSGRQGLFRSLSALPAHDTKL
jgi:hypothetical protein